MNWLNVDQKRGLVSGGQGLYLATRLQYCTGFLENHLTFNKDSKSTQMRLKSLYCLTLMETWLGIPPRYLLSLLGWCRECTTLCRKAHCWMDSSYCSKYVDRHFDEMCHQSCHSLTLVQSEWLIDFIRWHDLVLRRISLWKCYIYLFQCKLQT